MDGVRFFINIIVALFLGATVGAERQWHQRTAGVRTNALVSVGSAIFVSLGYLAIGEGSPTRMAAQVVSGIGFLGAGAIMREGLNVKGLNTAATVWCSAAVGTLAGFGLLVQAVIAAGVVLIANLALRPIARKIDTQPSSGTEVETSYLVRATCRESDESHIRALIVHTLHNEGLLLRSLRSNTAADDLTEVAATVVVVGQSTPALERVVSRLSLENGVNAVSWECLVDPSYAF